MKLMYIGTPKYSRVKLTKGKYYKVVSGNSGSDGSEMIDLFKLVTGTNKPVTNLVVVDDEGGKSRANIVEFDLSPLHKNIMTNKLQKMISEQYFTNRKIKEIAKLGGELQNKIKILKKELTGLEETFEALGEAVELGDVEAVENAISLLSN